jgi:hypothetical protein
MNLGLLSLRIALGLLVAVVAGGAILYATDYGLEADVVGKDCSGTGGGAPGSPLPLGSPSVTVKTKLGGLRHTQSLPAQQCAVVQVGNFVVYHVRSARTSVYQAEGGSCIYDSTGGPAGCP